MDNNLKKQTVCRCSNCGLGFDYSETKKINVWLYEKQQVRKVCPRCGSVNYSPSELDFFYDQLGKNKNIQKGK